MTKEQVIKRIYGESVPFTFDYALPIQYVDRLIDKALAKKAYSQDRQELYSILVGGCVYAYSKETSHSGLLPITEKAYTLLFLIGEPIFAPTLNI